MTDIKNIDGDVIFTSASPDDTIKEALEQAVKAGVSLQRADLEWTDLQGVDLRDADLQDTNLNEAKLMGANLRGVDLEGADLRGAKIRMSDRTFKLEACDD